MSHSAPASEPYAGSRHRWEMFQRRPTWVKVIAVFPFLGILILFLFPWEDAVRWFRGAPRWQQTATVVVLVGLVAASAVQQATVEREREKRREAEATTPTPSSSPPRESTPTAAEVDPPPSPTPSPTPTSLYPDRLDQQDDDLERRVGEPAVISGREATVTGARLMDNDKAAVSVQLRNVSDSNHRVSSSDFRLQMPSGTVADIRCQVVQCDGELPSVDVLPGGSAEGNAFFNIGGQSGDFYVIWRPTNGQRAIWQVTLP